MSAQSQRGVVSIVAHRQKELVMSCSAARRRGPVLLAAAFYLALFQILTVAHAASDGAEGPHHDPAACVLHVAADRLAGALPEGGLVLAPPVAAEPLTSIDVVVVAFAAPRPLPPPRGPPLL